MSECVEQVLTSPLHAYFSALHTWLDGSPFQAAIATCALAAGVCSLWDGPGTWRRLFIVCAMGGSASIARYEAKEWDLDLVSEVMLMVQAAFSMALASHVGFGGFQVLFGAAMGFLGAYSCGGWARNLDDSLPSLAWFWYTFGVIFGMLVFVIWRKPLLAAAAPLFGAFLVTPSVCWLISWASASAHPEQATLLWLPPPDMPFVDAALELVDPAGPAAMAGHSACTLLAAVIHGGSDARRLPAIVCLVSTVLVTMLASVTGLGVPHAALEHRWWSAFGCLLWAPLAAAAAWRQMGQIGEEEGVDLQRDIYASYASFNNNLQDRLPMASAPDGDGALSPTARAFHGYMSAGSIGGLRDAMGFGSSGAAGRRPEAGGGGQQTPADAPGRYVINQDPTFVSASSVVPVYDDEITDELGAGEMVVVLEVRQTVDRVRARIKDPPGWISLVNLETGTRLATRA